MENALTLINTLIALVGEGMTLGEVKTWVEVKENAESLQEEARKAQEKES